jgi:hypothetical protein
LDVSEETLGTNKRRGHGDCLGKDKITTIGKSFSSEDGYALPIAV